MKAVDRPHRWISVEPVLDGTRLEIRIHCAAPCSEMPALLDAREARALAHSLLTMADELVLEDRQPVLPLMRPASVVVAPSGSHVNRAAAASPAR